MSLYKERLERTSNLSSVAHNENYKLPPYPPPPLFSLSVATRSPTVSIYLSIPGRHHPLCLMPSQGIIGKQNLHLEAEARKLTDLQLLFLRSGSLSRSTSVTISSLLV